MNLPSSIIIEILSRLPLKSILLCRCVCTTWRFLISDPYFAQLHFTRSNREIFIRNNGRKCLSRTLHFLDLETISTTLPLCNWNDKRETKIDTRFYLPKPNPITGHKKSYRFSEREYDIVNSCNGLLCLSRGIRDIPCIVYNPVTGEFVTIPKPRKDKNLVSAVVNGFGYSSKSNEYKVVRLLYRYSVSDEGLVVDKGLIARMIEVYTVGTASWRSIGYAPQAPGGSYFATYLNGAIHWLCDDADRESESCDFIVAFDFEEERFCWVPPPKHFGKKHKETESFFHLNMGVLGGCLSVCDNTPFLFFHIWVMKEYGVQESWTKDFVVYPFSNYLHPIRHLDSGDILMILDDKELVLYNHMEKHFRCLEIDGVESGFEAIAHIPSFVSLKDALGGANVKVKNVKSRWAKSELCEEAETLSLVEKGKPRTGSFTFTKLKLKKRTIYGLQRLRC